MMYSNILQKDTVSQPVYVPSAGNRKECTVVWKFQLKLMFFLCEGNE